MHRMLESPANGKNTADKKNIISRKKRGCLFAIAAPIIFLGCAELIFRIFFGHGYWELPVELINRPLFNFYWNSWTYSGSKQIRTPVLVEDRYLFWRLAPNTMATIYEDKEDQARPAHHIYPVITNSMGLRSPEIPIVKTENTYRIACLGDSATFGYGLPESFTYSRKLEQILNSRYPDFNFEVINAGVVGYSSLQGRVLFEKTILGLKPNLITLCFGANDVVKWKRSDAWRYQKRQGWLAGFTFALMRIKLFQWLRFHILGFPVKLGINLDKTGLSPRVGDDEFFDNYRAIANKAREHGIDAMVLERYLQAPFTNMIDHKVALRLGIPFIPTQAPLKAAMDKIVAGELFPEVQSYYRSKYAKALDANPYYYVLLDFGHPTPLGNEIIAEEIFKSLNSAPGFEAFIHGR